MMALRTPWLLGGLAGSAVLLVVVVIVLAWRQGPGPLVRTLEPADERTVVHDRFPADFGRLADLVPFAGGVSPVASAVVPVAHGPEFRDGDWVKSQAPEGWTLQVLASQDEGTVKRFLSGLDNRADFVYFVHPQEGKTWYVVTTGSYSSRELALGVAEAVKVPDGARPFPRSMASYQEALLAAEAALVAPAPVVEVIDTAPAPVQPPAESSAP